jgi:hypothetical protein
MPLIIGPAIKPSFLIIGNMELNLPLWLIGVWFAIYTLVLVDIIISPTAHTIVEITNMKKEFIKNIMPKPRAYNIPPIAILREEFIFCEAAVIKTVRRLHITAFIVISVPNTAEPLSQKPSIKPIPETPAGKEQQKQIKPIPSDTNEKPFKAFPEVLQELKDQPDICSFVRMAKMTETGDNIIIYSDKLGLNILSQSAAKAIIENAIKTATGKVKQIIIKEKTGKEEDTPNLIDELNI